MTVVSTATSATTASTSSTGSTTANPYAKLSATDFLKLLTTQMKNQDPTQPVDNSQMIADMAQFTNVANGSTMNSTLSTIASKLDAIGTALGVKSASSGSSTTTTTA